LSSGTIMDVWTYATIVSIVAVRSSRVKDEQHDVANPKNWRMTLARQRQCIRGAVAVLSPLPNPHSRVELGRSTHFENARMSETTRNASPRGDRSRRRPCRQKAAGRGSGAAKLVRLA
jgi:hypothetical protein